LKATPADWHKWKTEFQDLIMKKGKWIHKEKNEELWKDEF
jgi:hypothetical protein